MKNGKHLIRGMRALLLIFGGFLLGWEAFGNSVKPIATFGEWTRRLRWSSSWNTGDLSRFATQAKTAYEKAIDEHCPRAVEHSGDYVVRFDGNGETSGQMEKSLSCSQEGVYQLPQNQFKKDGCRFAGWKCSNGRRYDDGMLFFGLRFWKDSDVIMTAIWE